MFNLFNSTLPIYKDTAIRVIGCGSRWNKSLMHHKFLIGMNHAMEPIWLSNGSFNLTNGAKNHLENCMIFEDTTIAKVYLDEFVNLYKISAALKFT